MKFADIKKKSPQDLQKHADKLRSSIAQLKREQLTTDDKNVMKQRNTKRELARTLTLINQSSEEGE